MKDRLTGIIALLVVFVFYAAAGYELYQILFK